MKRFIESTVILNRICLYLGGLAIVLMAIHVSLDAAGKYLLSQPIPATLEIVAYYYMPSVIALPLAFVEMKNGNIAVELVYQWFPSWLQRLALIVNGLVGAGFMSIVSWLAIREAWRKLEIGEFMFGEYPIIIWPGRFIFGFGVVFLTLVLAAKAIGMIVAGRDFFAEAIRAEKNGSAS